MKPKLIFVLKTFLVIVWCLGKVYILVELLVIKGTFTSF